MPGMIIAIYVLMKPIDFNIKNKGNIVTCAGTIIELNNNLKSLFLPLKRYLANAKAAIELNNNEINVTVTDKKRLFKKFIATFNLENKFWY